MKKSWCCAVIVKNIGLWLYISKSTYVLCPLEGAWTRIYSNLSPSLGFSLFALFYVALLTFMLTIFLLALQIFSIPLHPAGSRQSCSLHSCNDDLVEWEVQLQSDGPLLTMLSLPMLVMVPSSRPFRPRASPRWRMPLPHWLLLLGLGHCATLLDCLHLEIISLLNSSHYPSWRTISFLPGSWRIQYSYHLFQRHLLFVTFNSYKVSDCGFYFL